MPVGEGVVEGIEGSVRSVRELEAISDARVVDGDRDRVLARVPKQDDADAFAIPSGEFPCVPFPDRFHVATLRRGCAKHVVAKLDLSSNQQMIRAPTQVGAALEHLPNASSPADMKARRT